MESLVNFFISNAYADTMVPPAQGSPFTFFFITLLLLAFLYFSIWRPQNKRAKQLQALIDSIAKGDEVITAGGMLGKVVKLSDQYITLNVANNVDITMQKSAIVSVLPKGTLKTLE